jgi:ABC-type sugar transport system permease subunit
MAYSERTTYQLITLPAIVILLGLTVIPILTTFILSFSSLDLARQFKLGFAGLYNYSKLWSDSRFLNSLYVTVFFVVVPVAIQMLLGLVLALLLEKDLPGTGLARALFIMPMVVPPVVVGLMWKVLLIPKLGGLNYFLGVVGIHAPDWLNSPITAQWAVTIAAVWAWTPFCMLMFLAGLETLPGEFYEAAVIDGASWHQTLRFITLPLLRPIATVVLLFRIIEALAIFPVIFIMTGGGPAAATEPINYYAYLTGFSYMEISYAATLVVVFFATLYAFCFFFLRSAVIQRA